MSSRAEQKRGLREEREAAGRPGADAAARRKRTAYLAGGISLIALIVVAALVLVSQSGSGDTAADPALFAGVGQQGITIGDPKAPVTVVEFADLQCPFCKKFALDDLPGIVDDYVKPGDVKMELRLLAFIGPDSATGRDVAVGAAQQNRVWPFAENVYANQGPENSGYMTTDFLRQQASGISGLDADKAVAAIGTAKAQAYANESNREKDQAGVDTTPTFAVSTGTGTPDVVDAGGLRDAIDAALAQAKQQ